MPLFVAFLDTLNLYATFCIYKRFVLAIIKRMLMIEHQAYFNFRLIKYLF